MNDVINREDAIDAVLGIGHTAKLNDGDTVVRMSAVNYVLRNLPSAQPEPLVKESRTLVKDLVKDTISRQAAIDAINSMFAPTPTQMDMKEDCLEIIENLPTAQPEPCESDEAAKRLNDLIFDINPAEICAQIEADNLKKWCEIIQVEMKMAMVQLPCWGKDGEADEAD